MNGFKNLKYLSLVTQIGLVMAIPIFGMVLFGNWLDKLLGTNGIILIICILAGVYMAFHNLYNIVMRSFNDDDKDPKR